MINHEIDKKEISMRDLIAIVKPRIISIVLCTVIFGLLSFITTKLLITPTYKSSSTIIINNKKDANVQVITNDEINSAKNLASVYGIIIKSDAVLKPVIDSMNSSLTTSELSDKVSVISLNGTQILEISVLDENSELARKYVNEILKVAPKAIVDMIQAGSVKIISYPQISNLPIAPNVRNNVMLVMVVSFILMVIVVVIKHLLDRTLRSSEDIEVLLGIPVIGVIPNIDSVKSH